MPIYSHKEAKWGLLVRTGLAGQLYVPQNHPLSYLTSAFSTLQLLQGISIM